MSKNRETGTDIQRSGMQLVCVDHGIYSDTYPDKPSLLIAKAHPLQWCELCKKGNK